MKYLLLLLCALFPLAVLSCDCGFLDERTIDRATLIFEGTPVASNENEGGSTITYQFIVSKTWKGESRDTLPIEVLSPKHHLCFSTSFTLGKKYLVFSMGNGTSSCTFNSEVEHSPVLGLLRYKYEAGFKESLGKNNRKKLKKEEAYYLNSKFRKERGRLDFNKAKVVFVNYEHRISKKEYFDNWGGTLYKDQLILLSPLSRRYAGFDAIIIMNPVRDLEDCKSLEWLVIKLQRK